ncbi:hypothetical protein CIB95_04460 [Lottiidibacillus patelloidae]|uniref:Stage III sporulation protein AH n=1 Tax=Lottiidibacillus patelloidae TaxID=2670334 RepID=A0A263BV88_9BACI|nr:SpoIIIAH-like family protein [Lottiidibacillus patelloidae]OZM57629.1 hypothetical protein CIB95_04460 [Lottiidibacillus patelloidae]
MVLKKQTVWLLTMLSLIIVLSVFYISSPEPMNYSGDVNENGENATNNENDGTVISDMTRDDTFIALEMAREEKRSKMEADYMAVIVSADVTAEAKSEAYAKLQELNELAANEGMLEELIRIQGYDDVIVTTTGNRANILVKASEHTKKDAAAIMLLGMEQLGEDMTVMVEFLPNN